MSTSSWCSPGWWATGRRCSSLKSTYLDSPAAEAVSRYLTSQPVHHGYSSRVRLPVYRYRAGAGAVQLSAAHASFELNYHFVFSTSYRRSIFGSQMGQAVAQYWLKVATKHGFTIDQVSFVLDHVHLLVRAEPKQSVEDRVVGY
jgi:hypothetical protein